MKKKIGVEKFISITDKLYEIVFRGLTNVFVVSILVILILRRYRLEKLDFINESMLKEAEVTESVLKPGLTKVINLNNDTFMQLKFPTDGNYYVDYYTDKTYYSDPECKYAIETPRFLSENVDHITTKSSFQIYAALAEDGNIVYTPASMSMYLITEQRAAEWKELDETKEIIVK